MSNLLPELPPTFANLQDHLGQRTPPVANNPNLVHLGGAPVMQQILDYLVAHKMGMFGREGGAGGQYPWGAFSYMGLTPGTLPATPPVTPPPPPATPPAWPHPDWLSQIQGRLPRPRPLPVQPPLPGPQQPGGYGGFLRPRVPKPPTLSRPRQGLWPQQ